MFTLQDQFKEAIESFSPWLHFLDLPQSVWDYPRMLEARELAKELAEWRCAADWL